MDLGLAEARVVVTGGASNIGRGIVHSFAAEGARVVINDIDGPQAEQVRADQHGCTACAPVVNGKGLTRESLGVEDGGLLRKAQHKALRLCL